MDSFSTSRRKGSVMVGALIGSLLLLIPVARAGFKNLQVLPKTTTNKALIAQMNLQIVALGVGCEHCHDPKDPSAETPLKEKAREMMRMVQEINAKYPATMNRVTCFTCHRGKHVPEKPPGQ